MTYDKSRRRGPVYGEKLDVAHLEKAQYSPDGSENTWRPVHYRRPGAARCLCGAGKKPGTLVTLAGLRVRVTCPLCLRVVFPLPGRKPAPFPGKDGVRQEDLYPLAEYGIGEKLDKVQSLFRQVHAMCLLDRGYLGNTELGLLEKLCGQLYEAADELGTAVNLLWGEVQHLNTETEGGA